MDRYEVEVLKNGQIMTRLMSSHLDRTTLINKGGVIKQRRFRFSKNQE